MQKINGVEFWKLFEVHFYSKSIIVQIYMLGTTKKALPTNTEALVLLYNYMFDSFPFVTCLSSN
jgi:hypothetical protein